MVEVDDKMEVAVEKADRTLIQYGFNTRNKVYVIAELGLNHGGSIKIGKKLIDSAIKTGVDAVKFQTYITEKRVSKDSPIFSILKKCELPFNAFKELKDYAEYNNVEFISTPFDEESVDLLDQIKCKIYKIASFDITNNKLLQKISETKRTIIMSTGMSDLREIEAALKIIKSKTINIALLHCVSAYPLKEDDANLANIQTLKNKFDCLVGYSDHTNGIYVPAYAVAAGARIIEKHYKINEGMDCVDAPVSITELKMKAMIKEIRRIEKVLGSSKLGLKPAEKECQIYRRYSK